ncbi:MAG: Gfo/Idh/MocA family oxidoreductase, partial [Lewinella sp.]|nr:Gfo/Idh/MocA family oxidoreductase [Lewinella sp.]
MDRRTFVKNSTLAATGLTLGQMAMARPFGGNDEPLRLGVIGTGDRGGGIIRLLRNMPQFDTVACSDILPYRLEAATSAAGEGCRAYPDYRRLLDDPRVEAVVVATPLSMHYEMASAALAAGKHVYCEKTMTY